MNFLDIANGLVVGIVAGLVILYGLQPKQAYPSWMLVPYDHPWLFLVALFVIGYVMMFHRVLGALLFLLVASLYADLVIFGKPHAFKEKADASMSVHEDAVDGYSKNSVWDRAGLPLSDVVLEQPNYPMFHGMEDAQPGDPAPFGA